LQGNVSPLPALGLRTVIYNFLQVAHTGKISATIKFLHPVNVSWVEDGGKETSLGTMTFTDLSTKNSRATINQTSTFVITDEVAFGRFSVHLITAPNFTWHLQSSSLRVQALKFPVANGISFSKIITLKGVYGLFCCSL
jgi:Protein of unknown function (DUF3712)